MTIREAPLPGRRLPFTLGRLVGINTVITVAVTLIVWSVQRPADLKAVLAIFGFCFAFANLFGIPSAYLLSLVGERTSALRYPYNWVLATLQILFFALVGTLLGVAVLRALGLTGGESLWTEFLATLKFALVVALTVGLGVFAWMSKKAELDQAREEIRRRELAEAHATQLLAEARLASLESRVRPHFLFNTLNSIAALIPEDPQGAETTVQRLAALLRFSLDSSRQRLVDLGLEGQMVTDYLEIERARFGDRLRFTIDLPSDVRRVPVPPLALQTIVENSVKHVAGKRPEGVQLRVIARRVDDYAVVDVYDDGPGFTWADVPPGHGLDSLRERLAGLFGEAARLEVADEETGGACVRLVLPLEGAPSQARP
jgi:two-component system sensor histidine kinase AlgZ